jgi:serine kinase of HPr protein (carbohydrate metabolism regulator)
MANSKYITVTALVRKFNFDVLYKEGFKNKILIPSLNRTGIELASQKTVFKNIISAVL